MKKLLVLLLLLTTGALAQNPYTLSGTIQDPSGAVVTAGYVQFTITPSVSGLLYYIAGTTVVAPQSIKCAIIAGGQLASFVNNANPCTLWGNDQISPSNTLYNVTFAPNSQVSNQISNMLIAAGHTNLNQPYLLAPQPVVGFTVQASPLNTMSVVPTLPSVYSLGSSTFPYATLYVNNIVCSGSNCGGGGGAVYPPTGIPYSTGLAWQSSSFTVSGSLKKLLTTSLPNPSTAGDIIVADALGNGVDPNLLSPAVYASVNSCSAGLGTTSLFGTIAAGFVTSPGTCSGNGFVELQDNLGNGVQTDNPNYYANFLASNGDFSFGIVNQYGSGGTPGNGGQSWHYGNPISMGPNPSAGGSGICHLGVCPAITTGIIVASSAPAQLSSLTKGLAIVATATPPSQFQGPMGVDDATDPNIITFALNTNALPTIGPGLSGIGFDTTAADHLGRFCVDPDNAGWVCPPLVLEVNGTSLAPSIPGGLINLIAGTNTTLTAGTNSITFASSGGSGGGSVSSVGLTLNATTLQQGIFQAASGTNPVTTTGSLNINVIGTPKSMVYFDNSSTALLQSTATATDGQILVGSSTGVPALATLTAGAGATITNGHNTITISASGSYTGPCIIHYSPTSLPLSDTITVAGNFATSIPLTATCIGVNSLLTIRAHGTYIAAGTGPHLAFGVSIGTSNVVCPNGGPQTLAASSGVWAIECFVQVNTAGTTSNAVAWGDVLYNQSSGANGTADRQDAVNSAAVNLNTTTPGAVTIQETGTMSTSQSFSLTSFTVEVMQ